LEVKNNIRKVAPLDCTVLILGETGTGKELVARAIHMLSPRKGRKFMAANCGSFSEDLLGNDYLGMRRKHLPERFALRRGFLKLYPGEQYFWTR